MIGLQNQELYSRWQFEPPAAARLREALSVVTPISGLGTYIRIHICINPVNFYSLLRNDVVMQESYKRSGRAGCKT